MSSYVETHILPGEQVLYRATLSPASAYGPAIVLAVGSVVLGAVAHVAAVFGIFAVLTAAVALGGYMKLKTNEYALTDRRVLVKEGILVRKSVEMLLGKVEGISVDQNLFGRLFDFGSVTVNGTGGGRDPFKGIARPFDLRKAVQHQLEVVTNAG